MKLELNRSMMSITDSMPHSLLGAAMFLLLLTTAVIAGATTAYSGQITGVAFADDASVAVDSGVIYLAGWQSQTMTVSYNGSESALDLCAYTGETNETSLACKQVSATRSPSSTSLSIDWPNNATGEQQLTVVLINDNGVVDSTDLTVFVLPPGGDYDNDGLSNQAEINHGTRPLLSDTDGDGLTDGNEVNVLGTSPTTADTDDDGLPDGKEINEYDTNPTNRDTDSDGLADGTEVMKYNTDPTNSDTDGDGLADGTEVNGKTNPTDPDSDNDGLHDGKEVDMYGTDPTLSDTDEDGLSDGKEIREYNTDPLDPDTDDDGLTDREEVHQYNTNPTKPDTDGDGRNDSEEIAAGTDPGNSENSNRGFNNQGDILVSGGVVIVTILAAGCSVLWMLYRKDDDSILEFLINSSNGPDEISLGSQPDQSPPVTDEDRVHQMLHQNGGRLKQSDIVAQSDWSKSKVSRLLSKMAATGEIRKINIGRENLITHPDDEPSIAHSAFDKQE